jgi:hypothetical protein
LGAVALLSGIGLAAINIMVVMNTNGSEGGLWTAFFVVPTLLAVWDGYAVLRRRRYAPWLTFAAGLVWLAGCGLLLYCLFAMHGAPNNPAMAGGSLFELVFWPLAILVTLNRANRQEFA